MKTLKLLILLAAFAFTHQLSAQMDVVVNNNTGSSGNATFHFLSCANSPVSINIFPSVPSSAPYVCATSSFDRVNINYIDATCPFPQPTIPRTLDWVNTPVFYTDCSGTIVRFDFSLSGNDLVVDIN